MEYLTGSALGAPTMPEVPESEYPAEWELSHEEKMALEALELAS